MKELLVNGESPEYNYYDVEDFIENHINDKDLSIIVKYNNEELDLSNKLVKIDRESLTAVWNMAIYISNTWLYNNIRAVLDYFIDFCVFDHTITEDFLEDLDRYACKDSIEEAIEEALREDVTNDEGIEFLKQYWKTMYEDMIKLRPIVTTTNGYVFDKGAIL